MKMMRGAAWRAAVLLEQIADARSADADEHFDELRARDRKERHSSLAGNSPRQQRFSGSRRSSDILPGITATVSGFIIRFTRAVGTLWLLFGVIVSKAETCSSSNNSMERWRIFHAG